MLAALAMCATVLSLTQGHAAPASCAAASAPGGQWTSYGGAPGNQRNQAAPSAINAATAANLKPAWTFDANIVSSTGKVVSSGTMSNTPIVAGGCVYLATSAGYVDALNADTGALVWATSYPGAGQILLGGIIVGSPLVQDGVVYVGVSRPGTPYLAAIDQATGAKLWETTVEENQVNSLINASPVYQDGMIFMGFSGNEGGSVARGGFAIVKAGKSCEAGVPHLKCYNPVAGGTAGVRLAHTFTISDAEYAAGYRGASVWCTAAVDAGFVYACGGNPASKRLEARYSNALLKIDMRSDSKTFGQIVGAYKGTSDQYFPGLDRQPACDNLGEQVVYLAWSATCAQLDLDFGASPSLWRDRLGRLMVGDLQKAGIFHAVYADNMEQAWTTLVGTPCFSCNAASGAVDGSQIYVEGTLPGQVVALSRENGRYRWAMPVGDGVHFQSISTSNNVVYVVDSFGFLNIFDATNGVPIQKRPISVDTGASAADQSSQGVAIARNTVFVNSGEFLVAYRP
ncbi:MAG: PQQ-binding-like beta-propeller repeat protein [Actinomycetota bacterium]